MRDITLEDTIYFNFTTRSFSTGIPTQLAGSPVLSVLESNNATPITSGVSVAVDRASVTGLNQGTVVATTANGYEAGKSYGVYISTGTVGGVSVVGEVVFQFTIQASAAAVDLANGTDGLGAIKAETALIVADTNELQTDWVNGGRLDLILDIIAADTTTDIPATLATIAAYIDTEIAALITAVADVPTNAELTAALGTADDAVLTQIALVKAKTDSLAFTVAGQVDANVQYVNDVQVTGTGALGDEWGP